MIIAVPTLGDKGLKEQVAEHFGRSVTYTLLDEKGTLIKIIENKGSHHGGGQYPAEILKSHGVTVLLCKGLGPKALDLCSQLDIKVYVLEGETVEKIYFAFENSEKKIASHDDVCQEHRT
ncbi:MAG TPA: NifB/NifX family molybdenum-iron cluster-binding protein [Chlamydiales bacterium]|nr:NifB/NifX family molybdenum-iron cluster-binding protein [Chlamydiales bacterium]